MTPRILATLVVAIAGALPAAHADAKAAAAYVPAGTCAGFPRIDVHTPVGWCVALVADASSGLRFPRRVLEVAPGRYWLVDMGSWEPGQGRLLEFELPARAAPQRLLPMKVLADRLDRPLGIARGPEGRIYVAEATRIWRTSLAAPQSRETVVDGLPATGTHPLKEIAFGAPGQLFVNVGSSSDACRDDAGKQPLPCPDLAGAQPRAAVWLATLGGADQKLQSFAPYATGLRNSVALAYVPGARTLLQGENSIDYADEAVPAEKMNALRAGAYYGWPYCVGMRQPARGYEGRFDCAKSEAPLLQWPAHAAPLQMVAVPAAAGNAFAGQLLVAWHGYRAAGHRIVGYALDAQGRPNGPLQSWIDGWGAAPGVRPLGAPTGITVDSAGRLLIVEDRNRTLLMLVKATP